MLAHTQSLYPLFIEPPVCFGLHRVLDIGANEEQRGDSILYPACYLSNRWLLCTFLFFLFSSLGEGFPSIYPHDLSSLSFHNSGPRGYSFDRPPRLNHLRRIQSLLRFWKNEQRSFLASRGSFCPRFRGIFSLVYH